MVHPVLSRPADPGEQIVLEPKAFLELLKFIEVCKTQSLANLDKNSGTETDRDRIEELYRGDTHLQALAAHGCSYIYSNVFFKTRHFLTRLR